MRAVLAIVAALIVQPVLAPDLAAARDWRVRLVDCTFSPDFRAVDLNDAVEWTYDEGSCAPANHRVKTYGIPPAAIDSGRCDGLFAPDPDCLNDAPGRSPSFTYQFRSAGTFNYFCPLHAVVSEDGKQCTGMCGQVRVVGGPSSPTASPTASPTGRRTSSPTASATASPTGTATATVSPTGTTTATASPTGTATVVAGDEERDGGGGGRAFIAVAAIGVLGSAGLLVWRLLIARG